MQASQQRAFRLGPRHMHVRYSGASKRQAKLRPKSVQPSESIHRDYQLREGAFWIKGKPGTRS